MAKLDLFPKEQIVGIFRGFREGGYEFHAELVLPYKNDFQSIPMHGQFILVQLESPDEAALGRITSLSSEGKLAFGSGEEFNIRAVRDSREIPDDLRQQYLKYKINIRVLGVLRKEREDGLTFIASHRRLPHVGSPVAFPTPGVLKEIVGHNITGASIGHYALGEFIYAQGSKATILQDGMQIKSPEIQINFPVESLVSRRSFIFARAGFGKSNLNKLLFSKLYAKTPTVKKRGGKDVPVGTVVFDPDGEYYWPDDKGRPGLCDVPELEDKIVVFTPKHSTSPFYQSFVAGGIRLDIRRFKPADVISIALPPEKQDQQNVAKLKGLNPEQWERLVDLIDRHKNETPTESICEILNLNQERQEVEAIAARSNMTRIVQTLHDRSSQLIDKLMEALSRGKLCVVDISQMRGQQGLVLSGLILKKIFDRNQAEFTAAEPKTIPTIAVVEEAQSVLNEKNNGSDPYIAWVKEGRKYDLGALLITQQPGSIPVEILSQGDNWFIFHLLSTSDLTSLKKANAHFSDDILSSLLNEPLHGQGIFWSSVAGKSYPVPLRVLAFEKLFQPLDPHYNKPAGSTFARKLLEEFTKALESSTKKLETANENSGRPNTPSGEASTVGVPEEPVLESSIDPLYVYEQNAIQALRDDKKIQDKIGSVGVAWGTLKVFLLGQLPETLEGRDEIAYNLVRKAMVEVYGAQDVGWHSFKSTSGSTHVKSGKKG